MMNVLKQALCSKYFWTELRESVVDEEAPGESSKAMFIDVHVWTNSTVVLVHFNGCHV